MTPSERIAAIQQIAENLSNNEWSIIDLTLRQFGLPTTNSWGGTQYDYLVQMVQDASDEALSQLYQHLTDETPTIEKSSTLSFWQPGTFRVFISHKTNIKQEAVALKESLDNFHISSFVAHEDIEPTKEWQDEIELALETTDCLIALVTEDFHESLWTDQEIGIAIGKGKLIIPINWGGSPYGFLSKYQWFKVKNFEASSLSQKIFQILVKHNLSKRKFSSALVNKFESSHSFVTARANMALLEKVEYLDDELLKRIQAAHDTNSQINMSFGLTGKVQRLAQKMTQS